jgi:hypothetical protein
MPGAAERLAFTVQPSDTRKGKSITPSVEVDVLDASGNRVTGFSGTVEIALGHHPEGARLGGALTAQVRGGAATFSDLKISREGRDYSLIATSGSLPSLESAPFRITR